jgi:hypothetical protein
MIEKHACSSSCPCQQGKDKAIAERVVGRMIDRTMVERVASRYLRSDVGVARSVFTPQGLKIHRYRESVEITDMENAGKRGKKVQQLHITMGHMGSEMVDVALKGLTNDILHMSYGQVKAHVEKIIAQQKAQGIGDGIRASESLLRGIDVEPMGTTIELTNKYPDGAWLRIIASPHEFRVTDSAVINAPGKAAHGFHQDTNYWSIKREDGIAFYGWAKDNLSKLNRMNIRDLRDLWDSMAIKWNSH